MNSLIDELKSDGNNETTTETQTGATATATETAATTTTETAAPPATTTAVAPPAAETAQATATPTFEQQFEQTFGVKPEVAKGRITGYESLEQELTTLKATPPKSPYITDFGEKADKLYAKGVKPETIARFVGLDLATISDDDKIKLDLRVANPKWSDAQLNAKFNSLYAIPEGLQGEERDLKEADRATAAATAQERLTEFVAKTFSPTESVPDPQKVQAEVSRVNFWSGAQNLDVKIQKIATPIKYQVHGANGLEEISETFEYQVPEGERKALLDELTALVKNPEMADRFPATAEGIAAAERYLLAKNEMVNGEKMRIAYGNHIASKIHASYKALLHNDNIGGGGGGGNEAEISAEEQRMRKLMG